MDPKLIDPKTGKEIRLTATRPARGERPRWVLEISRTCSADLRDEEHADLLVGLGRSDDAAVYRVTDDVAIVETVDFFPPIVDDPYLFGAIAAANSMSDVYAMGGQVLFALNVAGFPRDLPKDIIAAVFRGRRRQGARGGRRHRGRPHRRGRGAQVRALRHRPGRSAAHPDQGRAPARASACSCPSRSAPA